MVQSNITTTIILKITFVLVILILGVILNRIGKPYNEVLLAFHKLASLAFLIYLTVFLINFAKQNEMALILYILISIALLSAIALFASGAFLSQDKMNELMLLIHRISTGSFLLTLVVLLRMVFQKLLN